ncbi:MAG: helix-turn-helix domain-containing protein, partial [Comamonas sp.]
YYRLAVLRLQTSPLRERGAADVALLARRRLASRLGLKDEQFPDSLAHTSPQAGLNALLQAMLAHAADYGWPGNVRELDNWVERLLACQPHLCDAQGQPDAVRLAEVFAECAEPIAAAAAVGKTRLKDGSREAERQRVQQVLQSVDGNQARACEILGISRATLWRRMKAAI